MERHSKDVLVADDERGFRRIVCRLLKREKDLNIHEAGDGLEALNIFMERNIDLVITDNDMPRIRGVDLSRIINIVRPRVNCPVILMSGNPITREDFLVSGAAAHIEKPFDIERLKTAVEDVFKREKTLLPS